MFECNNDSLFSEKYTVKDHVFNTKIEKGNHYYIQTRYKDLFSHFNLILRKLYEKMFRKALENTNEMCSCPWASYNTAKIELIQYGRRIGKKVYGIFFLSYCAMVFTTS